MGKKAKQYTISCIGVDSRGSTKQIRKTLTDVDYNDVIAPFRGAIKEDAYHGWVAANYPGYSYMANSGGIQEETITIKTPKSDKKASAPKSKAPKQAKSVSSKKEGKSVYYYIVLVMFWPFFLGVWIIKQLWKLAFNK